MTGGPLFPPSRRAALDRLAAFVPHAGDDYAFGRNTDAGPDKPAAVSRLSAYVRYRMITEQETVAAVLARHPLGDAEKYMQEVLWRPIGRAGWRCARRCGRALSRSETASAMASPIGAPSPAQRQA